MANCAECRAKGCRQGDLSAAMKDCPSVGVSPEQAIALYSPEELEHARISAEVEAEGYTRWSRVEETMIYAFRCGYRRLGVAFCAGFSEEAATLCRVLRQNGFEVVSVCCKNSAVHKKYLGVPRERQVRPYNDFEAMCNPAGQAAILEAENVDFVILLGLCVGHDTLFLSHCRLPVTVLATKDRATGNNPLAPLYTANSFFKNRLSKVTERCEKP